MATVRESIEVDAPIDECFQAWSNFENFPEFMEHVRDVRRVGNDQTMWVTRAFGMRKEWRATTTTMEADEEIAWRADGDVGMDGRVHFSPMGDRRTRVDVEFTWRGEGLVERAGEALHLDNATVKDDLRNFKEFVEGRRGRMTRPMGGTRTR